MKSLVIGGAWALGRILVRDLKLKGFNPISIDFVQNNEASDNIILESSKLIKDQSKSIVSEIIQRLNNTNTHTQW